MASLAFTSRRLDSQEQSQQRFALKRKGVCWLRLAGILLTQMAKQRVRHTAVVHRVWAQSGCKPALPGPPVALVAVVERTNTETMTNKKSSRRTPSRRSKGALQKKCKQVPVVDKHDKLLAPARTIEACTLQPTHNRNSKAQQHTT